MLRKLIVILMVIVVAIFYGCQATPPASTQTTSSGASTSQAIETTTEKEAVVENTPAATTASESSQNTNTTLKVWFADIAYSTTYNSQNEAPMFQKIEEFTGIDIDWMEPATGADKATAYNLMIATGDLPDIIWSTNIVSNALTYLDDGVIIDLSDWVNEKNMPNLTALYNNNPSYELAMKTDDGRIFGTVSIVQYECWQGPWVRTDWLDAQGLGIPETIEDWTQMLKIFKNEYNATYTSNSELGPVFLGAYGVPKFSMTSGFYQDNGTVQYVAVQNGFKSYLEFMHNLYSEGLVDPDFVSNDEPIITNKAANGETGALTAFQVSGAHILSAQDT